ncbi:MAG: dTMP kinase [Pirellulaceae bacterium]
MDGIDGAGKSTQLALLRDWLIDQGHPVELVRDPGSTRPGEAIRQLLLESDLEMHRRTEALLYMAARCQLVEEKIRPALAKQKVVLSDRFLLANVVYQSVGNAESPESLWQLGAVATDGVRPDLTLLLDLPADVALDRLRGPADRMESRGLEYMQAVREAFLEQLPRSGPTTAVIDASMPVQPMHEAILASVKAFFASST